MGMDVSIDHMDNPRKELEDHYYNPVHTALLALGLEPHVLTDDVVAGMLEKIMLYRDRIDTSKIRPRVRWKEGGARARG